MPSCLDGRGSTAGRDASTRRTTSESASFPVSLFAGRITNERGWTGLAVRRRGRRRRHASGVGPREFSTRPSTAALSALGTIADACQQRTRASDVETQLPVSVCTARHRVGPTLNANTPSASGARSASRSNRTTGRRSRLNFWAGQPWSATAAGGPGECVPGNRVGAHTVRSQPERRPLRSTD